MSLYQRLKLALDAHNAISDVLATKACFFEMMRRNMMDYFILLD